jgi:hypothetical protein
MYCIDLFTLFQFLYNYVCEDNFFFSYPLIFILLFFIYTFQLYYLWLHPPLFNVVFFIYLYAVTSFLQQILIFFWFPQKNLFHKPKAKQKKKINSSKKKKFTNLLSCQNNFSTEILNNHCDFVITSWHLIGSMIPSWLLLFPPAFFCHYYFFFKKVFF